MHAGPFPPGPTRFLGQRAKPAGASEQPAYAELHCLSDFSFQRGASTAKALFERAAALGYAALAITDICSMAGIVRALEAAEAAGVKLIVGTEIKLHDGPKLVLLAADHDGYTHLCRWITAAQQQAAKGDYRIARQELAEGSTGVLAIWLPADNTRPSTLKADAQWLHRHFPDRAWLGVELHRGPDDAARLAERLAWGDQYGIRCVATGDVHMHARNRRALQDVLTAIRLRKPVTQCGEALFPNGERHLRHPRLLSELYPAPLLAETVAIAARCRFSLRALRYDYPAELVPAAYDATTWLAELTRQGAQQRWPSGLPDDVQALIDRELLLIAELDYEAFFLTVADIVRFARSRGILCQGRGSAANSVVCFCLGITSVSPDMIGMLFERFISKARNEPPDIDVDFEHERREEVLQYVYGKYGRRRAALAATVICYRSRSAVRDIARALGLPEDQIAQLARVFAWGNQGADLDERLIERGFDPASRPIRRLLWLLDQLCGMPRHLSQHVGGFVISQAPLEQLVPVENAAMPDRTIIQWDKDDLETLGLLKVDCLALGMLSCLRGALDLLRQHRGLDLDLATMPKEDPQTYEMIQRADTLGVFQIESRAQMAMLPRLKPACFYDLVIQVAIVRPGPIQGNMVHPFLRRRQGLEPVDYPAPELEKVFGRTLGVPIFQEQVMHLAMVAAGFDGGEADELRRSMAAWRRRGGLDHWRHRLLEGMAERGYPVGFAERIFEQIKGFGSYGFPESHAASFALLVYASCWLKCHHPDIYACALLNAQPMGFYAPAQIVADARRHGVAVRPADVAASGWLHQLEPGGANQPAGQAGPALALRLGLRTIDGFSEATAGRIVASREQGAFLSVDDLIRRARLDTGERQRLAAAGALRSLAGHRHRAFWQAGALDRQGHSDELGPLSMAEQRVTLRPPQRADDITADIATMGLSLAGHPVSLLRGRLRAHGYRCSRMIAEATHPMRTVEVAGLVTVRQRPTSASGVTFVTLEDEFGTISVVVWQKVSLAFRRVLLESTVLGVKGALEIGDAGVRHVVARELVDLGHWVPRIASQSRDFH